MILEKSYKDIYARIYMYINEHIYVHIYIYISQNYDIKFLHMLYITLKTIVISKNSIHK